MRLKIQLFVAAFALLAQQAATADVQVQIALTAPQELEVSYTLPPTCSTLPFLNEGTLSMFGNEIRSKWQSLDDCGTADGNALTKTKSSCAAIRFKVPASVRFFDRVSPGSFPMGGGIYTHTTNYAVNKNCGDVHYHFRAPGSIAFKGRIVQQSADYDGADAVYMAALLLDKELPANGDANYYFDPALGAENIAQIRGFADQSIAFYRRSLPDLPFRKPILAATLVEDGGKPYNWGDAGDVLRLSLYNWPQQATPELTERLRGFVAHELAHRFQPTGNMTATKTPAYITEGGAEFLQWSAAISNHWISHEAAGKYLENALNQCMAIVWTKPWGTLQPQRTQQGQAPYTCGLSLHVFGLAMRQNKQAAMQNMNQYYHMIQANKTFSFEQAMECGAKKNCKAQWLPRMLGKQEAMADVFADIFAKTQLAKPATANKEQIMQIQQDAFASIMQEDCNGQISFYTEVTQFRIGAIQNCKTLKEDMAISQIEGLPLFGDAQGVTAFAAACEKHHEVTLGLKAGENITMACNSPVQIPSFFSVNIEAIIKNLGL